MQTIFTHFLITITIPFFPKFLITLINKICDQSLILHLEFFSFQCKFSSSFGKFHVHILCFILLVFFPLIKDLKMCYAQQGSIPLPLMHLCLCPPFWIADLSNLNSQLVSLAPFYCFQFPIFITMESSSSITTNTQCELIITMHLLLGIQQHMVVVQALQTIRIRKNTNYH